MLSIGSVGSVLSIGSSGRFGSIGDTPVIEPVLRALGLVALTTSTAAGWFTGATAPHPGAD